MAQALVNRPSLVLADEPTGSLDPAMGEQVADLFANLNQEHEVTLVTVTHNEALAERMGTKYELNKESSQRLDGQETKEDGVCMQLKFLAQSLWHYRKSHLGVLAGTVVGATVLLGALFAGDSVAEPEAASLASSWASGIYTDCW